MPPSMLEARSKLYWDAGYQLHIHVNGDAGLEVVMDMIERRMREHPRPNHRTVIVHFANSTEAQFDRSSNRSPRPPWRDRKCQSLLHKRVRRQVCAGGSGTGTSGYDGTRGKGAATRYASVVPFRPSHGAFGTVAPRLVWCPPNHALGPCGRS